jgi:Amidase
VTTPNSELCALGVRDLARLYRTRELSPVDVIRATIERIERLNPALNAYIAVLGESAMAGARAAEAQLASGIDLGPLHGVPVSVKDIICVRGTRTTAASRVLLALCRCPAAGRGAGSGKRAGRADCQVGHRAAARLARRLSFAISVTEALRPAKSHENRTVLRSPRPGAVRSSAYWSGQGRISV